MKTRFLNYPDWQATADTLHMFLQMAGKVKLERSPQRPEWAHVRLFLTIDGIGTGIIPAHESNFEIYFNLRRHHVVVQNSLGLREKIPLGPGLSVKRFYEQLMVALDDINAPTPINVRPQEFHDPVDFDQDDRHASYDRDAVTLFLENLHFAYRSIAAFMAPWRGKGGMPAYWFGTMDLTGTLFSGQAAPYPGRGEIAAGSFDEKACEFGFWPGDPKSPRPSFFVLPYPFVSDIGSYEAMLKPDAARFLAQECEYVLPLEDALATADPQQTVVDFCSSAFAILQRQDPWPDLDWATEALTYPKRGR